MARSINKIKALYDKGEKIVAITSYTAPMAKVADEFSDIVLVGDSVQMVLYGKPDTTSLDIECIINHARAVSENVKNAFVVCDIPFSYYEQSPQEAFKNISHIIKKTGTDAIKIEGGAEMADTINFLTQRGIVVMAHIGLMPQRVRFHGSYKTVKDEADELLQNAKALQQAGAFSIVLENTNHESASFVTANLQIPTIGIGSGSECSGQIAVFEDICGLSLYQPPFAKKYANLLENIKQVAKSYTEDVKGTAK